MQNFKMRRTVSNPILIIVSQILAISTSYAAVMDLTSVKLIENNDSRLVATSNYNYAISSPKLQAKNWKTVSVNGDKISMVTMANEVISNTRATWPESDRVFVENLRDEMGAAQGFGYETSMSSSGSSGPGGSMVMSSSGVAGSSSSYSASSSSSSVQQRSGSGGISFNMRDDNNFSVSKSDLPYNWSTVYINGDLVTFVYRDGEVEMRSLASLEPDRLAAVEKLKGDLKNMQRTQEQQISSTMQHSMDMVSNVFNNILGQFPKPPNYKSAVGNMFGDNFPFGSNNSPFSSSSGWPFGGGGAFAFASRR